ncbi:glycoside hydrolase family 88 protein [Joostella atrarenae]|uniref:Glycoside hydrolase family 88 protein n=1 Tax=Joostella atrarenae TaxID=679257 RepID=A0ABS9J526_9FLAO|nr:glycoside hydrolase family 88 protein [Joostella atrarenae]MCF8715524.1 glycoside hydrolase family 88 protein [Joostella atrarenae]
MKEILNFAVLTVLFLGTLNTLEAQIEIAESKVYKTNASNSESYRSFTFNGSWCWFSDPRAVYYEGKYKRTYGAWVDNYGNIVVGYYDHDIHRVKTKVLKYEHEIDDHDNPSILFDNEGKILVFFNRHGYGDSSTPHPIFLTKSSNPEDISTWEKEQHLFLNDEHEKESENASMNHDYTNPIKLRSENNRIFLFWRGIDGKPGFSYSDDAGVSWADGKTLFKPEHTYSFRRPYTKVYSNGDSKIHFVFTDGHPRNEKNNSIYYTYYEKGAFYKANGEKIKNVGDLPLYPNELDLVYNGKQAEGKAWNWDIAEDKKNNPVIMYATFPTDSTHYYNYAKWTGKKWLNNSLVNSGKWFMDTRKGSIEAEPNYSGGMNIDHENPNEVYLSVKRDSIFEIEKWITNDDGESWKVYPVTKNSTKNNIRPFAVRGAKKDNPLQVMWMQNTNYITYSHAPWTKLSFEERFHSSIKMNLKSPKITDPLNPNQIIDIMRQTADWQFANPYDLERVLEWHWATYFIGLQGLYEITKEDRYKEEMINVGKHANWRLESKILYADNIAIASNWAWLYNQEEDSEMIENAKYALDVHLSTRREYKVDLRFLGNPYFDEWWTWSDALFMGPPTFIQMWKSTGEEKYLNYMDTMFWKTADYLYSREDSLMFRDDRYFPEMMKNNKKVFWSRGNGWVVASIARILDIMPKDYPNRFKYEMFFKEMILKVLSLQRQDGLWNVSLLDPDYLNKGETSGSSFFIYALAYALNNEFISEDYKSQIEKGWIALCMNVNENGRLGNVQPEGIDPKPFVEESWHVYGTGGFLLAGKEMYKLMSKVKEE